MNNLKYVLLPLLLLVISCGKKEGNTLADKKAKLETLQKKIAADNTEMDKLKSEIEKLDPVKEEKIKTVAVSPIIASNFQHFVEASGRLEAENNVLVSPQTGGAITKMYVKLGDFVRKGQTLATIDNSILRNSIQEIQVQLETAKTIYDRQKNLWDQKIGTEVQFIQAKTNVESLERRITTLKSQIAMNNVVAPISGMVDEVRSKSGEMAAPGLAILRLINSDNLKVVANVPDTYAGTISKGDLITVKFPDLKREVSTRLTFVSQTINPTSRTFTIEARVPKLDNFMKPNLMALVSVNDLSKNNSIVIPQNLIQNTEQGAIVYVAVNEGNKKMAKARVVSTGLSYNGKIEIKSGLSAADLLITEGYQEIVDGQLINY